MSNSTFTAVTPDDLNEVAPGIFYTPHSFVLASAEIVEFLKAEARSNATGRARVCAHPSSDAPQHDMLIASHRDTYVAPHRHKTKSESFTVIEGEADLLMFEDDGALSLRLRMGAAGLGAPFFYRMPAMQFHSLDIVSDVLVFVESTIGPFRKDDMECAIWAPAAEDYDAGRTFISSLAQRAGDKSDGSAPGVR